MTSSDAPAAFSDVGGANVPRVEEGNPAPPEVADAGGTDATRALAPATFGRSMRIGARFGAGAAFGMWIGDLIVLLVFPGRATHAQWLTGVGAALFVALTTAVVSGTLLGPLVPAAEALRSKWRALREEGHDLHHVLAARALTLVVLVGVWSVLAYRAIVAIDLGFARPDIKAGAYVVSHWLFVATLVVGWFWGNRLAQRLIDRAARISSLRWLRVRMWLIPAALLLGAIGFGVASAFAYRAELGAVPWHNAIPLVGSVLGLGFVGYRHHAGKRPSRVLFAAVLIASAAATVAASRLRPESGTARAIAFDRTLSGHAGLIAWTAVTDFDLDGQISVLGGGDCAPFDPTRHTGAVEIPDNGIDEDCDGTDLHPVALRPRPRAQVGQGALPARPTVVFITIDALGAPRLTALGSPVSLMPRLDDFASRSVLFDRCFAPGPSTRLSFPSLFTSQWNSQLFFQPLPRLPFSFAPGPRQLQDVLDDAGYETVAIVPTEYFGTARWPSLTRGFQRVDTTSLPSGKHNAPQVTDAALRVLSEQRERPLYLWMHYYDAHPPYEPLPHTDGHGQSEQDLYEAELTYIDRELGRLLEAIDRRSEPTYAIITADHSTVFHPAPATRVGHYGYDLYSATLHVPLVVHGPGIDARRVNDLVSIMDVAPTVIDLLRLPDTTSSFEGTSLAPELLAGRRDSERILFHEYYLPERKFVGYEPLEIVSLHQGPWNLVLNRVRGTFELYDWTTDYFEQTDLYEQQSRSPEVRHLKLLLASFLSEFAAPL